MIRQGFFVGDHKWYVMCAYDIATAHDLEDVERTLLAAHCHELTVTNALDTLAKPNTGFTFTTDEERLTLIFVSRATSAEQMYDSIQHELKHAVEHISKYYRVRSQSEEAAYLQGEIARQMYPAAAMLVCPKCNNRLYKKWNNSI